MTRNLGVLAIVAPTIAIFLACGGGPVANDAVRPVPGGSESEGHAPSAQSDIERPPEASGEDRVIHPVQAVDLDPAASTSYPAWKAIDGSLGTTWVAGGEPLELTLPMSYPRRIELVPGYAIDERRWTKNRRPTKVKVRLNSLASGQTWGPWTEFEVSSPDTLPAEPYVTLDLPQRASGSDALQIAIVEATPRGVGMDDDVCISELRVVGGMATTQDVDGPWHRSPLGKGEPSAPFTRVDLDNCVIDRADDPMVEEESRWEGTCTPTDEGVHVKGRMLGRGSEEAVALDRTLSFIEVNPCLAFIDGDAFSRPGCLPQY